MPTTLSKDEILEAIGNMSVFELHDLIETFKTRFNVTIAAAQVGGAAPAGGGAGGAAAPAVEEKTEFDVVLKEAGAKMKAMHDKAAKSCEGKQGREHRDCMRHEMCAQAKDPKACEARAEKAKAAMQQARKACEGKQGDERRSCMRQEMHKQEK